MYKCRIFDPRWMDFIRAFTDVMHLAKTSQEAVQLLHKHIGKPLIAEGVPAAFARQEVTLAINVLQECAIDTPLSHVEWHRVVQQTFDSYEKEITDFSSC